MKIEEIISDEDIVKAFGMIDHGGTTKRNHIKYAMLKKVCGYESGHTINCIMQDLGLFTRKNTLTSLGKEYLWAAFSEGYDNQ